MMRPRPCSPDPSAPVITGSGVLCPASPTAECSGSEEKINPSELAWGARDLQHVLDFADTLPSLRQPIAPLETVAKLRFGFLALAKDHSFVGVVDEDRPVPRVWGLRGP